MAVVGSAATEDVTSILHLERWPAAAVDLANGQYFGSAADLAGLLAPLLSVAGAPASPAAARTSRSSSTGPVARTTRCRPATRSARRRAARCRD